VVRSNGGPGKAASHAGRIKCRSQVAGPAQAGRRRQVHPRGGTWGGGSVRGGRFREA